MARSVQDLLRRKMHGFAPVACEHVDTVGCRFPFTPTAYHYYHYYRGPAITGHFRPSPFLAPHSRFYSPKLVEDVCAPKFRAAGKGLGSCPVPHSIASQLRKKPTVLAP
jgi:hypothetical protein